MQLSLFGSDYEINQSANGLLEALNDGRKNNEKYIPEAHFHTNGYLVLIAKNNNSMVGNILNNNGNTPDGFSACWRKIELIMEDLNTMV